METLQNVKKQVESFEIKYIPLDDPLDRKLNTMISQDGKIKYSASYSDGKIKVYCKKKNIELIRKNLEEIIRNKIANKLWISMLKEAHAEELYDVLNNQ